MYVHNKWQDFPKKGRILESVAPHSPPANLSLGINLGDLRLKQDHHVSAFLAL